jgi:hypothetical protein
MGSMNPPILSTLAILGGLAALMVLLMLRHRANRHQPGRVFAILSRRLRIPRSDRRRLRRLAAAVPNIHPASLLISPGCFDFAMQRYARAGGDARAMAALQSRLHGTA